MTARPESTDSEFAVLSRGNGCDLILLPDGVLQVEPSDNDEPHLEAMRSAGWFPLARNSMGWLVRPFINVNLDATLRDNFKVKSDLRDIARRTNGSKMFCDDEK